MRDESSIPPVPDRTLDQIEAQLWNICGRYQPARDINLYIPYYRDRDEVRNKEIELCLRLNTRNRLFDRIYILSECDRVPGSLERSPRIVIVESGRLTFKELFDFANARTTDQAINILVNSDIVIGEGFDEIALKARQAFCISRYEVLPDGRYEVSVGGGSHDCWAWRGRMVANAGEFFSGKFLCDGVLANELTRAGYHLKNPMLDLRIYHVHLSGIRNYGAHDLIRGHRTGVRASHNDHHFTEEDMYWDGCN